MALLQGTVYSEALRMQTRLTVFLPGDRNTQINEQKTMYLLHGLSDAGDAGDAGDAWVTNTSVCRYAQEKNTAVIMPEGHRSFYSDMPFGSACFTYITEELPELCRENEQNPSRPLHYLRNGRFSLFPEYNLSQLPYNERGRPLVYYAARHTWLDVLGQRFV